MNRKSSVTANGLPDNSPQFAAETHLGVEFKKKSPLNHRLINCILVFCMASGILTTSVVIHLGIENYNRLQECRELRAEIEMLKWRLNVTIRRTNSVNIQTVQLDIPPVNTADGSMNDKRTTPRPSKKSPANAPGKSKPEPQRKNLSVRTEGPSTKEKNPRVILYPETQNNQLKGAEPSALFEGDASLQDINTQMRHCAGRIRELERIQQDFDSSQDFLRLQMHQRFAALENIFDLENSKKGKKVAFSAFISSDISFTHHEYETDSDAILSFDTAVMNEGSAFNTIQGQFRSPQDGVFVFHLSLHVMAAAPKRYADTPPSLYDGESTDRYKTCVVKIRKNRQALMHASSKVRERSEIYESNYQNYENTDFTTSDHVTLSVTLVTRLKKNDIIDSIIVENPSCVIVGRKSTMISSFQGYYLHG